MFDNWSKLRSWTWWCDSTPVRNGQVTNKTRTLRLKFYNQSFIIFSPFFRFELCLRFSLLLGMLKTQKNMAIIVISHSKSIQNKTFRYTQILMLTVMFATLVGHIELKKLTNKAGLWSHTMLYASDHYVSI